MESFGFDNEKVKSSSFEKFQGKKNESEIISFAYENPDDFFIGAKQHYSNRLGMGWQCLSPDNAGGICCTHEYDGNEAKWRIVTPIVIYAVKDDNIVGIKKILPWPFSSARYEKLKAIYKRFGHCDLLVTCTDDKYQNFEILPNNADGKKSRWLLEPKWKAVVEAKVGTMKKDLPKFLSKKLSEAEIREHLGIGGSAEDAAGHLDLSGIAESLTD